MARHRRRLGREGRPPCGARAEAPSIRRAAGCGARAASQRPCAAGAPVGRRWGAARRIGTTTDPPAALGRRPCVALAAPAPERSCWRRSSATRNTGNELDRNDWGSGRMSRRTASVWVAEVGVDFGRASPCSLYFVQHALHRTRLAPPHLALRRDVFLGMCRFRLLVPIHLGCARFVGRDLRSR